MHKLILTCSYSTLQKLMAKTSEMEATMPELEHFVRTHRDQFPEETTIVQCMTFFRLKGEQLKSIGVSPDAEVFGAKQLEILVVPYASSVNDIMSRYRPQRSHYKIEYRRSGAVTHGDVDSMVSGNDYASTPMTTLPYSYSSVPTTTWVPCDGGYNGTTTPRIPSENYSYSATPTLQSENYSSTATPVVPSENYRYKSQPSTTILPPKRNKIQKEYERYQADKVMREQAREVRKVCRPVEFTRPSMTSSAAPDYAHARKSARQSRRSSTNSVTPELRDRKRISTSPPGYKNAYTPRRSSIDSLQDDRSSVPGSSRRRKFTDIAPQFTSALTSKRCNQGQSVSFTCSLSSEPTSDVHWFRGHRRITHGSKYHISVSVFLLLRLIMIRIGLELL